MADLKLVVTTDGEGYYISDGDEESDAADWSVPVEFRGVRYLGETDGETATLSIVTAVAMDEYETEEEGDDEDEEEDTEGVDAVAK